MKATFVAEKMPIPLLLLCLVLSACQTQKDDRIAQLTAQLDSVARTNVTGINATAPTPVVEAALTESSETFEHSRYSTPFTHADSVELNAPQRLIWDAPDTTQFIRFHLTRTMKYADVRRALRDQGFVAIKPVATEENGVHMYDKQFPEVWQTEGNKFYMIGADWRKGSTKLNLTLDDGNFLRQVEDVSHESTRPAELPVASMDQAVEQWKNFRREETRWSGTRIRWFAKVASATHLFGITVRIDNGMREHRCQLFSGNGKDDAFESFPGLHSDDRVIINGRFEGIASSGELLIRCDQITNLGIARDDE